MAYITWLLGGFRVVDIPFMFQVVRVVKDTMNNIHPVYLLKALMIKRQLMQDSNLKVS